MNKMSQGKLHIYLGIRIKNNRLKTFSFSFFLDLGLGVSMISYITISNYYIV